MLAEEQKEQADSLKKLAEHEKELADSAKTVAFEQKAQPLLR